MAGTSSLNFAPYSDPPDITSTSKTPFLTSQKRPAWFASSSQQTLPTAYSGYHSGGGVPNAQFGNGEAADAWETRFGWRIDVESGVAYIGGVITAIPLLILETHSSHVRFHAYQSLLLDIIILSLHAFFLLIFPKWFQYLLIPCDIAAVVYLARRAFKEAPDLEKFRLPIIGDLAERWVEEE
ncbi:hypothetical protein BT69DRAFT_1249357 [Atractiella rhizophila]|nr:hypothetical protein BT69DRAFT_1249357 [Atractiella rhizophila]